METKLPADVEYWDLEDDVADLHRKIDIAKWKQARCVWEACESMTLDKAAELFGLSRRHIQNMRNAWDRREFFPMDGDMSFSQFYNSDTVRKRDPRIGE